MESTSPVLNTDSDPHFISIIIPVFNEEAGLALLRERLIHTIAGWSQRGWKYEVEIIIVNDGSTDRSKEIIHNFSLSDTRFKAIHLSRNFGHQEAISAGMACAGGDCAIIMDADLQDPPELIEKFIEKWLQGNCIVYGIRKNRKESFLKKICYNIFYRILKKMANIDIPLDSGDFCLMDRSVIDTINALPEKIRFVRGLRSWTGFSHIGIEYDRAERQFGSPKYTLRKLLRLAFNGFFGFTTLPLRVATAAGFIFMFIGFFLAANYLKILGLSVEVVTVGAPYVRFTFIGSAAIAFRMMAEAILQASGDTVTPMWASFIYIGARVVLSPFLIFGTEMFAWWILPGLGITGAAVAMTAAHGVAMVIMLWVLFRGRSRLRLTLKGFRLDPRTMWRITKIGLPALISMIQQNLYQLVLVRLMAPFGTVAVAAHGLLQRVEGLIIMPAMAVGMGSGVLVGQNLGAKKTERATKSVWLAFIVLESFIILCSLAIYLWPGAVVRVFNSEPDMIATAGSYLRIAIAGFVAVGFWMVFMQSLNGAGGTIPPMVLSVVSVWLVGLPLAILLPRISELGAYGVRWGIAFSIIANGVVQMAYFLTGRWKRKKV